VNDKTPSTLLSAADEMLKKKKQGRYFAIAGFALLLAQAITQIKILMVMAIALLCAATLRNIQVKMLANRIAKESHITPVELDQTDAEVKPAHTFEADNAVPSVLLQFGSKEYEVSFQYEKADGEGDDILLCKSRDREVNVHPASFLKYLESSGCDYLHNRDKNFIESLKHTPCLKFGYLEDSRDYPSIKVEGTEVSIMCKYLCPVIYIFGTEEAVILVVDELRDENGEAILAVITSVKETIFLESTAEFSVEEGVWIQV
jgi:hypothetical protein